jgi:SAM-dependent methyltransferase
MNKKEKTPWPTKVAMEQIYERKLWGGQQEEFYSGEGSHLLELVNPYIEEVSSFLSSFETPLVVCDLGCGDFNVGKELVKYTQKYIAVDIADNLIQRNKSTFNDNRLEFHQLDIAKDELPQADCALLRQVLQHLSNAEIHSIVEKLNKFKYVILTEHLPEGKFIPNKDILSGQGIRLKKNSGVDLLAAPFHLKIKEEKRLLTLPEKTHKGQVVTRLYQMF